MQLFDTHAHLDSEAFTHQLEAVVGRAQKAGVAAIVVVGTSAETSRRCVEIAQQFPGLYAAVGIQPNHTSEALPEDWDEIVKLAREPKVVAIGETGLDRYWDRAPFAVQQDYFDRHLRLARKCDLAFIVHMRDCGGEVVEMLRAERERGELQGVMHSYTGDEVIAAECLELGLYLSFAGMVTYKKSEALRLVAAQVPADRILIETDAPYLSPHPHRGKRPNEPAWVVHTAQCLAEARDVPLATFAEQTWRNATTFFRV